MVDESLVRDVILFATEDPRWQQKVASTLL
jgi:hypothetical protein